MSPKRRESISFTGTIANRLFHTLYYLSSCCGTGLWLAILNQRTCECISSCKWGVTILEKKLNVGWSYDGGSVLVGKLNNKEFKGDRIIFIDKDEAQALNGHSVVSSA